MNKKKKIYISLPIKIAEHTVKKRYQESVDYINKCKELQDYEITGPVNIEEFGDNGITSPRVHDYAWYMGQDIMRVIRCDAIFMSIGWEASEGCCCELETAKIYNKKIFYQTI